MIKLDRGFCHPFYLRALNDKKLEIEDDSGNSSDSSHGSLEEKKGEIFNDGKFARIPMSFMKYWLSKEIRNLWSDYLQIECLFSEHERLNALFLATVILDRNNDRYIAD